MIDAYKIGVTFSINSQFASDLAKMVAELGKMKSAISGVNSGLNASHGAVEKMSSTVGRMEAMFNRMKNAAHGFAAGVSAMGGIHTLEAGVEHLWEPAAEQRRASLRQSLAGANADGIKEMRAMAAELAKSRGDQTETDYMKMQGNLFGSIQDAHEVAELAPAFADFGTAMSMNGQRLPENEMVAAFKVIEARGKLYNADHTLNRAGIIAELTDMAAAYNMTEGRQKPSDTYASVQTMGAANASAMSEQGFYGYGTELAQAMKNTKLGTSLTALGRQFDTGVMTKTTLAALVRGGWVHLRDGEGHPLVSAIGSGRYKFAEGAIEGNDLRHENSIAWLIQRVKATQASMKAADPLHRDVSTQAAMAPLFSSGTANRAAGEANAIATLLETFAKNFDAYVKAHPLADTAANIRAVDPTTNLNAFTGAFTNLMAALGNTAMDSAIGYLKSFTTTLQGWTDYVKTHEKEVGEILDKAAAFGLIVTGLAGLVVSLGLLEGAVMVFGIGAVAQTALETLTGEKGLKALAAGIKAVADVFDILPPWLISAVKNGLSATASNIIGGPLAGARSMLNSMPHIGAPPMTADQGAALNAHLNQQLHMMAPGGGAITGPNLPPDIAAQFKAMGVTPNGPAAPIPPGLDGLIDGLGVNTPAKKSAFIPPASNQNAVRVENIMYLDGDVVHRSVTQRLVRSATLPDSDYSGFDGSRTARTAGQPMPI